MEVPKVLCIGNVLLDINYHCKDDTLLKKYHLQANDSVELSEWQMTIFDDILSGSDVFNSPGNDKESLTCESILEETNLPKEASDVYVTPGGAAQNTARIMQWCLQENIGDGAVAFTGCVGKDRMAAFLENHLRKGKVDVAYKYHATARTGACAALITPDNQRSLSAHIGASQLFSVSHLRSSEIQRIINKVKLIYCEGFFITHSFRCIMELIRCTPDRMFCLNLSGVYVCEKHFSSIYSILPFTDILFGNSDEAEALAKMLGMKNPSKSTSDVITYLAKTLPPQSRSTTKRIIVVTRGSQSVIIHDPDGKILSYNVPLVTEIIDTVGAGDSFVAGFLAAHCLGKSLDYAVNLGISVAQEIIQQKGCTVPNYSFKFENTNSISPKIIS